MSERRKKVSKYNIPVNIMVSRELRELMDRALEIRNQTRDVSQAELVRVAIESSCRKTIRDFEKKSRESE